MIAALITIIKGEMKMKKWRCTICGYIHEGENPPDVCPVCGVGPEFFDPVEEDQTGKGAPETISTADLSTFVGQKDAKAIQSAMFKISYGLFIVTSIDGEKINGQAANTVFQITSSPVTIALGINKSNLTHEFIEKSGSVGITILGEDGHDLVRRFGYSSGRDKDKFEGLDYVKTPSGVPVINGGIAFLEGKVLKEKCIDMGTHTLFVAEVMDGAMIEDRDAMTYAYFRKTK